MPANYPDWTPSTPKTHPSATATRRRTVTNALVIRVTAATYRNSQTIDGVFELVSESPQQIEGEDRFEVYCAWFGVKPFTNYPRISVQPRSYQLVSDYSGEVIDNISSPQSDGV